MANCSNEIFKVLALNIKKYRNKAGLSQITLGVILGKSPEYISKLERGARIQTLKSLCEIAQALNVKPHQLLTEEKI